MTEPLAAHPDTARAIKAEALIPQYQSALNVCQAEKQAATQMINELTNANVHLRSATLLLQGQVNELVEAQKIPHKHLDEAALIEIANENKRLTSENDRLNRVVAAFDKKLTGGKKATQEQSVEDGA